MKLREIENYGFKILNEKSKDGSMTIYAKFAETEKVNQNSRIYPHKIMAREVDRVQSKIASGQFLGQQDHGDSPATFLKDVSHIVTKLEMIGNDGFATVKILNTEAGKNIQQIVRGGGRIGISTRSVGTVSATGRINDDLKLLALDLVANPSVKDATFSKENILEGLNFEEQKDNDDDADTIEAREEELSNLLSSSFDKATADGCFYGTFAQYKDQYEPNMRKVLHLPENSSPSEKKLTEEQVKSRTYSYFEEALRSGYHGTFAEWKEKFPKLVEKASEPIKISKAPEPKEPFKARITWAEAVASGFRGTIAEYREKFPQMELVLPAPRQKLINENETFEEQCQRVFETLKRDDPNSSITLEEIRRVLKDDYESKREKKTREMAIRRVNRSLEGCGSAPSQAQLKEMVAEEIVVIEEERKLRKERNWAAYKKLLDE